LSYYQLLKILKNIRIQKYFASIQQNIYFPNMGTRFHILLFFASLVFSQNEIDIKNLKPIENIYFAKNSKKPFSGSAFSFSKLTQKKF